MRRGLDRLSLNVLASSKGSGEEHAKACLAAISTLTYDVGKRVLPNAADAGVNRRGTKE